MPDEKGEQLAFEEGYHAFQMGHLPYCPFGPDCCTEYYVAWHAGYIQAENDAKH